MKAVGVGLSLSQDRLSSACLTTVCTAHTKMFVHVKDSMVHVSVREGQSGSEIKQRYQTRLVQ